MVDNYMLSTFAKMSLQYTRSQEMSGINTDPYRACIADVAHHMDTLALAERLGTEQWAKLKA